MMNPHQIIQKYPNKNGRLSHKVILQRRSSRENVKKQTRTRDAGVVCEHCNKTYANNYSLHRHIMTIHKDIPLYTCEYAECINYKTGAGVRCNYKAQSKKHLEKHIKAKHKAARVICEHCNKTYAYNNSLHKHIKTIHKDIPLYTCEYAECKNYKTTTKNSLEKHIKEKHGAGVLCEDCNITFCSERSLKIHIKQSAGVVCKDCKKKFCSKRSLKSHIKAIHKGLKYTCVQCNKKFTKEWLLRRHIQNSCLMFNHKKEDGNDYKTESNSENPTVDYSTNPPGAAGFSGSTETLPQSPTLPSAATQASATTPSLPPASDHFSSLYQELEELESTSAFSDMVTENSIQNTFPVPEIMPRQEGSFTQQDPYIQQSPKRKSVITFAAKKTPTK